MEIDNFELIRGHLAFVPVEERWRGKDGELKSELRDYDRYVIHVMRRPKDCPGTANLLGANESQRLIKTYFVDNLEYYDRKIPAIKELCRANNARAYILLQVRNTRDCLLNLSNKITEVLLKKNYGIKPERLLRQAYCDFHSSRNPVWMLDVDDDQAYGWTKDAVLGMLEENLRGCGKDMSGTYVVPTRNGYHVVTPPFNTLKAEEACPMVFSEHRRGYDPTEVRRWFAANSDPKLLDGLPFRIEENPVAVEAVSRLLPDAGLREKFRKECLRDVAGWLHKDAATLLYAP